MITDEEAIRLLELADPARVDDAVPLLEPAEYREALQMRVTTLALIDHQPPTPLTEATSSRRWPIIIIAAAAVMIVVGALVLSGGDEHESPTGPPSTELERVIELPVANGLIAFVGGDTGAWSDIYVIAPDGSGLRPLTSTPELTEYAPAWSPDGSRLAFVRTADEEFSLSSSCEPSCQLVVVDPSTGVETFAADIPQPAGANSGSRIPRRLVWSPDGRAIEIASAPCGDGGCGPTQSVIADLETEAFTTFTPPSRAVWSPDGESIALAQSERPFLWVVPAGLVGPGDVDVAGLPGVRTLPEHAGDWLQPTVEWMPDGSAIVVDGFSGPNGPVTEEYWIDVVSVADGGRRTLIEDGFDPVVSPDGTRIAYLGDVRPGVWVANADGSNPRQVALSSTPPVWSPDGSLLLVRSDKWFTVRPDGTDRTTLDIRDHTPSGPMPRVIPRVIDWQRAAGVAAIGNRGTTGEIPADQPTTVPQATTAAGAERVGFVGLPPEGATPSTPETGELVVQFAGPAWGSRTWVYADGRLIWHRYADIPEGANEVFTGFLEQRLTPEGVELLRSETVSLGLRNRDPTDTVPHLSGGSADHWVQSGVLVRDGGHLVTVAWPGDDSPLVQRLTDPASWLPASAWRDRQIRAYVPSKYKVCLEPPAGFGLLPEPAQDLLKGDTDSHVAGCADLTNEELRALDNALNDAGVEQESNEDGYRGPPRFTLWYRIDRGGDDAYPQDRRHLMVEPYLPHGMTYCQHCG